MTAKRPYLTKTVTDAEALAHTQGLLAPLMHHVVKQKVQPEQQRHRQKKPKQPAPEPKPVKDDFRLFLQSIFEHPNDTVTERKDRFGWSSYKANKIKQVTVRDGYAVELNINLGRKTRGRVLLLQLSKKGYDLLGQSPPDTPGYRMSPEHWWWQCAIAQYYGNLPEARAEIEYRLGDKRVDVAVIRGNVVDAYEVEMAPDNAIRNAKADLEAGAGNVTIACRDARIAKAVGERLAGFVSGADLKRIRLVTLAELPVTQYLFGKGASKDEGLFAKADCQDTRHTSDISRALVIPERR